MKRDKAGHTHTNTNNKSSKQR